MEKILIKKKKLVEIKKIEMDICIEIPRLHFVQNSQCRDMNHLEFVENSQCQVMPGLNESFG
jgi:hypothetical protein